MKKINVTCAFVLGIMLFSSCVTSPDFNKLKLESDATSQILNLKVFGENVTSLNIHSKLVEGYFDKTKPEYGYATFSYSSTMTEGDMALLASALITIPLYFVGFPTDSANFKLEATFSIYDSNGNLVKRYSDTDKFYHVAGIYYGHKPTKKASKRYSAMFTKMFKTAASESQIINQALLAAGPITFEKDKAAIAKIRGESKEEETTSSQTYYNTPASSSTNNTAESISNIANSLQQGMKELNDSVMNNLKNQPCGACRGNGKCSSCGGTGKRSGNDCFSCHGSGVCTRCNGTGKAYAM